MTNDMLNKMSQVVFMLTCGALVTLVGIKVWDDHARVVESMGGQAAVSVRAQENALPVGSKLETIDGISFEKSNLTVALVLQSGCPYCTASMDFYKRVSELRLANKFQLIALSTEPTQTRVNAIRS